MALCCGLPSQHNPRLLRWAGQNMMSKTTASPSRFSSHFARFPIPCVLPLSFVSPSGGRSSPVSAWPLLYTGLPVPVPSARRWRSSRVPRLPLCAHAPLADSGGVLSTRHSASRTGAFRQFQNVGFPQLSPGYPFGPQIYKFRSSVTRPIHSLHLASHTPSWLCMQVRYRFGG